MRLTIDWSERASYRTTIEAPAGYDTTQEPWQQADEVSDALWEALRDSADSETTRYDAEIEHCETKGG